LVLLFGGRGGLGDDSPPEPSVRPTPSPTPSPIAKTRRTMPTQSSIQNLFDRRDRHDLDSEELTWTSALSVAS
jgi:hypothetical protein